MTTTNIKESLNSVAVNLANIKKLTKSAKKYCSQKYKSTRTFKHF